VLLLGLGGCALLGWSVRRELRPIADFARAVDSIGPDSTDLPAPRLPRREFASAYGALGAMLGRLQAKLRSERAFAAHAAHALRTPLAGLSAQLEVVGALAPAELAERIGKASASAQRLAGVIGALLSMTRATDRIQWRNFDATGLAIVAAGRRIEVDASQLDSAGTLRGDGDLLAAAVANLLDNSERHGASHVRMQAGAMANEQFVSIEDDGPGVPPATLARLEEALERFQQIGAIDSALGLGLTLAASVARAHGGVIRLECIQHAGTGFRVRLSWPAEPVRPAAASAAF
jgi:signal transduction histidine kinase